MEKPIGYIAVDFNGVPIGTGSHWKGQTAKLYATPAPARRLIRGSPGPFNDGDIPREKLGRVLAVYLSRCQEV